MELLTGALDKSEQRRIERSCPVSSSLRLTMRSAIKLSDTFAAMR
jgi:hypothetical protein